MRKLLFLILLSLNSILYAQTHDLKFYSSSTDGDYENDFSGVALAIYIEEDELDYYKEYLSDLGSSISKLTKNNKWLIWKAISEWEFYDGESYFVGCAKNMNSEDALAFIVTITEGGDSFEWEGVYVEGDE